MKLLPKEVFWKLWLMCFWKNMPSSFPLLLYCCISQWDCGRFQTAPCLTKCLSGLAFPDLDDSAFTYLSEIADFNSQSSLLWLYPGPLTRMWLQTEGQGPLSVPLLDTVTKETSCSRWLKMKSKWLMCPRLCISRSIPCEPLKFQSLFVLTAEPILTWPIPI